MTTDAVGAVTAPRGTLPMVMVVLAALLSMSTCGIMYVSKVPAAVALPEAHHGKYTDRVPLG